MSKKKAANANQVDESILENTTLITNQLFESDDICRDIVTEQCVDSAIQCVHQKLVDARERERASTDILNDFIYFGKWCYMNKDDGEQNLESWKQEQMPQRIIPDSWSTNIIPIRKITQTKETLFEMKANSKTNSVRSGQSNRSKISKGSLRPKLKRMDSELKKPLKNIMDEHSEVDDLEKVEIIQLKKDENTKSSQQKKKHYKTTRQYTKSKGNGMAQNKENNSNSLSINLKDNNRKKYTQNRPSMHIGLKTGRLSMAATNAYKYHPNKPFTYDHTGQKMSVSQIKPDKIPNNIVTPLVSFDDDTLPKIDTKKDKKSKTTKPGQGVSASRKNRKKSNVKSKSKSSKEPPIFKTNSVPVQPPIETVIKVEGGVSLKTKNTTIKGTGKKKNTIENLTRSEYNQYIETLRHMTKTHVFDACKLTENADDGERDEDKEEDMENQRTSSIANDKSNHPPIVDTKSTTLKNSSPKTHRSPLNPMQRMKQLSPKTIKYKRGRMSQQTDRLISEYNKASLLPKIHNNNTYSSNEPSIDLRTAFKNKAKLKHRTHPKYKKYQRNFVVKNSKSKIEKSKLGKALFGGK